MTETNRHNPATRIAALSTDPPTGWVGGAVRHDAKAGWTVTTRHSRVEVDSGAGYSWKAWVAARADSLRPGAYRLEVTPSPDGDWPTATPEDLEAGAIAASASIVFADSAPLLVDFGGLGPLLMSCEKRGKRWRYYVDRVRNGGTTSERVERRGAPDYRQVAEVYLEAQSRGQSWRQALVNRLDCPSASTAGKWLQRSAEAGWLTRPEGGSTRGARTAGQRLLEAWDAEGGAPSWWAAE